MQYRPLGTTGLRVSALCLGTMTFGEQNSEAEAHAQLDRALDAGINFIDTAELYPVPPRAETQGRTEAHIGSWLAKRGGRERLILATKVAGASDWLPHIRNGRARLDRGNIQAALEASLRRLGTDYVDLYQLHWPSRQTNYFGQLGYAHQDDAPDVSLHETLAVLGELVEQAAQLGPGQRVTRRVGDDRLAAGEECLLKLAAEQVVMKPNVDQLPALVALADGRQPDPEQQPAIGCNIKWHPGAEPEWGR